VGIFKGFPCDFRNSPGTAPPPPTPGQPFPPPPCFVFATPPPPFPRGRLAPTAVPTFEGLGYCHCPVGPFFRFGSPAPFCAPPCPVPLALGFEVGGLSLRGLALVWLHATSKTQRSHSPSTLFFRLLKDIAFLPWFSHNTPFRSFSWAFQQSGPTPPFAGNVPCFFLCTFASFFLVRPFPGFSRLFFPNPSGNGGGPPLL